MRLVHHLSQDSGRAIDFIEITMRPDFEKAVNVLRQKWEIDLDLISDSTKEAEEEWLRKLENSELRSDVEKMLKAMGLPQGWEDVVHQYVVDGNIYRYNDESRYITKNPDGLVLEVGSDEPRDIRLRVGPETVFSDFKLAWQEIKRYRKSAPKRKRNRKNFLRDYEIFNLARKGKNVREINAATKEKFGKAGDLDYGNIKKIVSSFYTRLKVPKKDRAELKQ